MPEENQLQVKAKIDAAYHKAVNLFFQFGYAESTFVKMPDGSMIRVEICQITQQQIEESMSRIVPIKD